MDQALDEDKVVVLQTASAIDQLMKERDYLHTVQKRNSAVAFAFCDHHIGPVGTRFPHNDKQHQKGKCRGSNDRHRNIDFKCQTNRQHQKCKHKQNPSQNLRYDTQGTLFIDNVTFVRFEQLLLTLQLVQIIFYLNLVILKVL